MTLWIVTTGNSDVQMKHNDNWEELYEKVQEKFSPCKFRSIAKKDPTTKLYLVPARVLGEVYCEAISQKEEYYNDLVFPLLETYCKIFKEDSIQKPTEILVLLTNQSYIFSDTQREYQSCPYWQDTCTLKLILERYFLETFEILPTFATIVPKKDLTNPVTAGIDNWDAMVKTVGETLDKALEKLNVDREKDLVYVSHQAGTPAISSAVQFLSIGQFKQVQFLVSNPVYDDETDTIQGQAQLLRSSRYSRGIKFADIKKLLNSRWDFSGAKEILQEFEEQYNDDSTEKEQLFRIINSLQVGEDCLNLDIKGAKSRLNYQLPRNLIEEVKEDDRLLNLYTQCRIYWQLDQTANFLSLVSSFYEGILERIFQKLGSQDDKFKLNNSLEFLEACDRVCDLSEKSQMYKKLHLNYQNKKFKDCKNRYNKRCWINLLLISQSSVEKQKNWKDILNS